MIKTKTSKGKSSLMAKIVAKKQSNTVSIVDREKPWSEFQVAFFEVIGDRTSVRHVVLDAVAGSGKTTTLVEGLLRRAIHEGILGAMAFNKNIAVTLSAKFSGRGIESSTLHSAGYGQVRHLIPGKVGPWITWEMTQSITSQYMENGKIVWQNVNEDFRWKGASQVQKVVSWLKATNPFVLDQEDHLDKAIDVAYNQCQGLKEDRQFQWVGEQAIACMRLVLSRSRTPGFRIDFDDMIWLPLVLKCTRRIYDVLCVDEAQDMNFSQLELAKRLIKEGGRLIIIGDPHQAIYSWRGAETGGMARMAEEMDMLSLSLPVSYRCPKIIGDIVREFYVPHFQTHCQDPNNGSISEVLSSDQVAVLIQHGDSFLSRLNGPLVSYALQILKIGKRAKIAGKDLEKDIMGLFETMSKNQATVSDVLDQLDLFRKLEEERINTRVSWQKKAQEQAKSNDLCDCLEALLEGCENLAAFPAKLEYLFCDEAEKQGDYVRLSSVHKAKGLEWKNVFVDWSTWCIPSKTETQAQEELNLKYVAMTRTFCNLYNVNADHTFSATVKQAS